MSLQNVADVRSALDENNYLASDGLATAVFLAMSLNRPLLLEGEAGVGKTELAKVLATSAPLFFTHFLETITPSPPWSERLSCPS